MIFILVTLLDCTPEPPHMPDCTMEFSVESFKSLRDESYGCYVEMFGGSVVRVTETCDSLILQAKQKSGGVR